MSAPAEIVDLVERFDRNADSYLSPHYNEAQVRQEFIDPFFRCLGWDIENRSGYAEVYKDVVHEDSLKVEGALKAPDYSFRVGGTRKFFLEAKKPFVNIKDDPDPAFQLRRYAWSAKLALSTLTDFEEFAVYDCRVKPSKGDKASTARIRYYTYKEYPDRWSDIASTFSREAVLRGAFDRLAESDKAKRGTAAVDDEFLKDIETWRELLARNIALRNADLSQRELNFAVQVTIDRIIFLRICEDRGIEPYGQLRSLCDDAGTYQALVCLYEKADDRYNSGLFHFHKEHGRATAHDDLTPELFIDDRPLKQIIRDLYYPSPYAFSVIPAEILGQVYEQFLGKAIRLTAGHHAVVEDKPEVKKAGGVFYTPSYVVDYIVENTVEKLLEGKTPKQASFLRILDPACGSGSFLIGAYQRLLDWHRDWYVSDGPKKHAKEIYQGGNGDWRLTTAARRRILLANIFGVDIDAQAVEVTKLSLLLKVLEGENEQTLAAQLRFLHDRALPDLDNIKCGNSLIAPDYYEHKQQSFITDEDERYRVNAFDWNTAFRWLEEAGGFDVVIGNPPYIPIESMTETERSYYPQHHHELLNKYDSSVVFILAMLPKLRKTGLLGFISSLTWQTGENFARLRERLFTKAGVRRLVNLPFDVFKNAYVDTGIYILSTQPTSEYLIYRFPKKRPVDRLAALDYVTVATSLVRPPEYKVVLDPTAQAIFTRSAESERFAALGSFTISTQGLAGNRFRVTSEKSAGAYPFLVDGQVYRYAVQVGEVGYTRLRDFPSLEQFYKAEPKILVRRVINRQDRLMATFFDREMVFKKDINPFILTDGTWDWAYVLGVLNSRLISYLYVNKSTIATKDDFRQTTLAELRRLPIPKMSADPRAAKKIAELAKAQLAMHKQLAKARAPHDAEVVQTQIAAADQQIDQLVFRLYELTDDEVKLVKKGDAAATAYAATKSNSLTLYSRQCEETREGEAGPVGVDRMASLSGCGRQVSLAPDGRVVECG